MNRNVNGRTEIRYVRKGRKFRYCFSISPSLTGQDSLPYRDLYFATKGAFELLNNDQEVWTNLLRQLNHALEDRFDRNEEQVIKSHTPYLMRSLILYLTHNPESNAFLRTTLENFMEDEFKKLSLLGKSEILADMVEK